MRAPLPVAPRTGVLAVRAGMAERRQPTQDWDDKCQMFCRTRFLIGPGFATAIAAFRGADDRETSGPAAAEYSSIGYLSGPPRSAGHAVVMVGGGLCLSNDIRVQGRISLVPVTEIIEKWSYRWEGWTRDTNGARILGHGPSVSAGSIAKAQRGDHDHRHGELFKRELADLVGRHGMNLRTDQVGAPMRDAVAVLQRRLGLKPTGLVGPRLLGYVADHNHKFTARP